jgi:hypothetical protein
MPGNTSESPIMAHLGEQSRRAGIASDRANSIKEMAQMLQDRFGINFDDPKSIQAGMAKLKSLHTILQRDTSGTASQDNSGDQNAVTNIAKIMQSAQDPGNIFDNNN